MLPMLEDHRRPDLVWAAYLPVGLASPLWLPFAAATGAGLAFWWMTRWTPAANLETWAEAIAPPSPPSTIEPDLTTSEPQAFAPPAEMAEAAAEAVPPADAEPTAVAKKKPKPPEPDAPLH